VEFFQDGNSLLSLMDMLEKTHGEHHIKAVLLIGHFFGKSIHGSLGDAKSLFLV
jgi:hypothetical protein